MNDDHRGCVESPKANQTRTVDKDGLAAASRTSCGRQHREIQSKPSRGSVDVHLTRKSKSTAITIVWDQQFDGKNECWVTHPKLNLRTGKLH